ncbi:MAG: flagellar motor switch protein FliN [Parvularculaceae bacterium]
MSAQPESARDDDAMLPELSAQTEPAGQTVESENAPVKPLQSVQDVPVTISAVLGKTKIDVASLMKLGKGAVIELDRKVGEPIDLYVNERLIARGELVMADGALGVTMTEIVKDDDL